MHILAPSSGYVVPLLKGQSYVKSGDILVRFDIGDADLEIAKADAAIAMLADTTNRLISLANDSTETPGLLRRMREDAVTLANQLPIAYDQVLKSTKMLWEVGARKAADVAQADYFLAAAKSVLAAEQLSLHQLRVGFSEGRELLTLLSEYAESTKERAQRRRARLDVKAPFDGLIEIIIEHDGWVSEGTIVASYRDRKAALPQLIIDAPVAGIVETLPATDGSRIEAGEIVVKIDTDNEVLHLSQLGILSRQMQLIRSRLEANHLEVLTSALTLRENTVVANRFFKEQVLEDSNVSYTLGSIGMLEVQAAKGAYDQALLAERKASTERNVFDIAVGGIQRNTELFEKLIRLEEEILRKRIHQKSVRTPKSGSVVHYVTTGSFVSPGTPMVGIL